MVLKSSLESIRVWDCVLLEVCKSLCFYELSHVCIQSNYFTLERQKLCQNISQNHKKFASHAVHFMIIQVLTEKLVRTYIFIIYSLFLTSFYTYFWFFFLFNELFYIIIGILKPKLKLCFLFASDDLVKLKRRTGTSDVFSHRQNVLYYYY